MASNLLHFSSLLTCAALGLPGCGGQTREYSELPTEEAPLVGASQAVAEVETFSPETHSPPSATSVDTPRGVTTDDTAAGQVLSPVASSPGDANPTLAPVSPETVPVPPAVVCGDGKVEGTEECDDGTLNSDERANVCRTNCSLPSCGDGVVDSAEECDDANALNNDGCTNQCTSPRCGDAVLQSGEACDDGNRSAEDACSNDCSVPGCGDGVVQMPREECDDAGDDPDACTAACKLPRCGDGFVQSNEECDDGNAVGTDACTALCHRPRCGDGIVSAGENCEDGNTFDGDGCSSTCQTEVCGDGVLSTGESCEDGNTSDGDGCSSTCQTEVCGDQEKTGIEQCDDGNRVDNDGCSALCRSEYCGDGVVQTPREQCEDLNTVDSDLCRNGCKHAASLNALSSSCANLDQITQTVCMVAVVNWCKQFGQNPLAGMVTGQKADNEYSVGCIAGFESEEIATSQLDQCQPGRQQSPACLEQIAAGCRSLGYGRGFYLGTGSGSTFAVACAAGTTTTESVSGCNGISATNPVPVTCAGALSAKCGNGKGGMIQARASSNAVTYTCLDLTLTGTARQF